MNQPSQRAKVLAICHYIYAGLMALCSLAFAFFVIIGLLIASGVIEMDESSEETTMAAFMFVGIGLVGFIGLIVYAVLTAITGRFIERGVHRTFCMVIACIECLNVPLGTILGVFTLIELTKTEPQSAPAPPLPPTK